MPETFSTQQLVKTHHALGTQISLQVFASEDADLLDESVALIDHYEDLLTVNRDHSEVMSINQAAGQDSVHVSSPTYQLIQLAVRKSRENFGFNALIGPVVKLWHIGFKDAHVPTDAAIKEKMTLIAPEAVAFDDDRQCVALLKPGMELDLGGIAKGWIADRVRDLWRARGVRAGIINLGGNVLFVGQSPKNHLGTWNLGVQDPRQPRGKNIAVVRVPECSAVTSGVYERFLEIDGQKFHHLIDPRTGYPVKTALMGVTTFTKDSVEAEIECKRLFFAGRPLLDWQKQDPDRLGAVFVYQDNQVVSTFDQG